MTYARARLWIGITGVGTAVVLSTLGLVLDLPQAFARPEGGFFSEWLALFLFLLGAAALMLPFDLFGGFVLPRQFARAHPNLGAFFGRWLRGVLTLSFLASFSGSLLLAAGSAGGTSWALVTFALLCFAFLQFQGPLAALVGGLDRVTGQADSVHLFRGSDPGFTGGFSGLSPRPMVPAAWSEWMSSSQFALLLKRRRWLVESGTWRMTQILAVAWNTIGLALASLLPGAGFSTLPQLLATILGFTLWTFVGLLLLPKFSRRATLNADRAAIASEKDREVWASTLTALDKLQDDEPVRSKELESVFHPVPSLKRRVEALSSEAPPGSALGWHLARTALYLSHVGLSLLPRAVHCNSGRPELWVYMPSDG